MPRSIAEIRKANGGLANLTDEDILQRTFQTYKSYYPSLDAYAAEIGYGGAGRSLTGSRISAGVDQYQANLLGLGGAVARSVGAEDTAAAFDTRRVANESAAAYAAQRARDLGGIEDWRDVTGVGTGLNFVGGLAAQSLPYLGEAAAGALTGGLALGGTAARMGLTRAAASTAGAVGASYPSAVGDVLSAQREAGGENLGAAALGGIPYAALNALGIEGQLARGMRPLIQGEGGLARRLAVAVPTTAVAEGLSETGQELINQYAGRMVIDPNETLFNEAANKRYLDSFVGGAALGGVFGGVGGLRSERPEQGAIDLTQPDTPAPLGKSITGTDPSALMGNPLAGANLLGGGYPVGLTAFGNAAQPTTPSLMSQETDLTAPAGAAATTPLAAETPAATTPAPSKLFSDDEQKLLSFGITPSGKTLAILPMILEAKLTEEQLDSVRTTLAQNKYKQAEKIIKQAAAQNIINAMSVSTQGVTDGSTGISTVQQPAGGVGVGGAVVPGTLGTAGSDASLAGAVGGGAATTGAPLQQVSLLPNAAGQPSTVVDQGPTTRGAPGTTALVDTSDDALEIARATGNAAEIEAMRQDQEGGRADQLDFGNNEMEAVIDQHLAKSKNKDRDRKILQAYILARKSVPEGYKGNIAKEIADTFGVDASRVRQIGNPEILANIAEEMGFDRGQVFTHLGIDSATKAAATELGKLESDLAKLEAKASPSKADIAKMSELSEKIDQVKGNIESGDLTSALKTLGVEGEAGEMFASLDDSREWQKASTAGSQMAVKLVGIADKIAELKAAADELKQLGLAQAEAAATERINALAADYQALTASVTASKAERKQTKTEKKTEAAQKAAEEKDAAQAAEAEKLRAESAAKRAADRKGLEVGDTVMNPKLGTGVVKGFSGDGDATIVTVDFQSGQTKELSVKMAKLEKTNAVQVQSTAVVPFQSEAQTGQGVGGQVRGAEKPAGQGQTQGQAKGQVDKGRALWESLTAKTPGLVPYDQLTKLEQEYLTELAVRTNGKPVVAKEMGLQQLLTKEPVTIDVEARVIDEQVTQQVAALPAPQVDRLEKHYGAKRDTAEFLEKVQADITKYVTQGAEAVAGAIRSIIKAMAEGVLAMGIVFNPNITKDAFTINVGKTFQQTIEVTQEVPEAAKAQMSPTAQAVYSAMAPVAMKSGKWFMVADKPNGMLHIFKEDGSHALSDATLYGKDKGDVLGAVSSLEGGPKITPAGKFTMKESPADYAGGTSLILMESKDYTGYIAVHAADTSTPSENRLGRLASAATEDNRISYGCINTKHDTFINEIKPNISKLDGGMMFILPEAEDQAAKMFAAETRTETRTEGGEGAKGKAAATLVGKEETIDAAVNRILRMSRQTAPLFSTDLYLGKENVAGQPQYGRELRNPVTLANGARLDGFTSLDQSVFSGYDRNGQRVSVAQSAVKPEDVMSSRDSNRTANAVKAALGTRRLRLGRGDTVEVTAGTLKFDGQITDEASLRRFPGVESALAHYENNDLRHVIDKVELWMVAPDTVDFDAAIMMVDGKQTLAVRSGMLVDTDTANWSIHHELGHVADAAFTTGGIYSGLPEFNLTIQKGAIRPMGSVVSEVMAHMAENPDSAFTRSMGYPLDRSRKDTKNMTADEVRMEVFAQLWAFFNTRAGNNYLADNLPLTYDFMEASDEAAKQNKGSADAQTGATAAAAATQAQAYRGAERVTPAILRIARPSEGLVKRNIAKLPKASQSPVRTIVRALGDLTGSGLDYVVFTSDLIKRAVDAGLTSAQTFADALSQRRARVSELEREIERIADGYADIEPEFKGAGRGSVNDFLFESTRTLKWGYDSGKLKADPEMKVAFNKLGPKAQQFVKNVFAHGDKILSQKKQVVLNSANTEYDAMIQAAQDAVNAAQVTVNTATDDKLKREAEVELDKRKAELATLKAEKVATLKRFQTLFAIREGKPYAPIKRDGAWVVIGKSAEYKAAEAANDMVLKKKLESDADHYHVTFVDTKWQARTLSDNLSEQGVFAEPDIIKRADAFEEAFSGEALLPALTKIRSAVDKRNDSDRSKMLNIVNQLYLEALADGSARKSEMRRRGVAGEVDMLQSFTRQGRADANFIASVEFEPRIQDALQQMRNDRRGGDRTRKTEIFDELTKRYTDSLDPKGNAFITGLTNTASKYFLASSPAYYLQNLTQPFMMSLPAMAGRHNYTKAGKALFDAYAELGPLFKNVKLFDQQFDFSKVPADVQAAIKELVNQGQIDIGLATEINEYKVDADNKLGKFAQRLNKSMRLAVQKAEAINRLSTAIAAYRLEFAKTKDAKKATQYAAGILEDTHGDYTSMNAPRIFNSQWGQIALQFRKFQLIQIAFYAKLMRDAFTNPAERAVAMRTLAFSLGHSAVFAGMMGIPGYAAIAALLKAFSDEDEPYDLTAEMRNALGPEWADMVMRGAPTLVGVDLSGKIGSGNMLSIIPFSDADLSTTAGRAEAFGTLVGGASLGMVSRVADGLGLILSGDYYKGIERTMPKGISDALKAGRQAEEGMTRRNGDVVLPAEEISAISAILTGLGVPSVKEAVVYERQNRMRDVTQNFQERTTRIKNDYVRATKDNDAAAKQAAREAWTKLQRVRQENGLKVQPLSDLLKAPQEQAKRERMTVGGVQYTKSTRKLAEEIAGD